MAVKEYIKRIWRNNSSVSDWSGWSSVKNNAETIGSIVKGMGKPDESDAFVAKTFEEAVKHYGLSEADLKKRMRAHLYSAIFSLIFGILAVIWSIHLLIGKSMFFSALVSLGLSLLMFSYAFREHFFYFKIKERRLDCTVAQWLKGFAIKKGSK